MNHIDNKTDRVSDILVLLAMQLKHNESAIVTLTAQALPAFHAVEASSTDGGS